MQETELLIRLLISADSSLVIIQVVRAKYLSGSEDVNFYQRGRTVIL